MLGHACFIIQINGGNATNQHVMYTLLLKYHLECLLEIVSDDVHCRYDEVR